MESPSDIGTPINENTHELFRIRKVIFLAKAFNVSGLGIAMGVAVDGSIRLESGNELERRLWILLDIEFSSLLRRATRVLGTLWFGEAFF
jgi:hypothetical protein